MIRAPLGDEDYWNKRESVTTKWLEGALLRIHEPSKNPTYKPQYVLHICFHIFRMMLIGYSRGKDISELPQSFSGLLETWEKSNQLSNEICQKNNLDTCRDWKFSLSDINHYNWCFWMVGLALTLEIPDDQWQRLLTLIGEEGEDILLDKIISSRQPERKIGSNLLHKKPYARLLKTINSPQEDQAELLYEFVNNWYAELFRKGKGQLWWYIYGDPEKNPLEMGSYFGRWCIEATAAVKAFNLDDSLCLGHEHYPGDLLRPKGPTTHSKGTEKVSWFKKLISGRK